MRLVLLALLCGALLAGASTASASGSIGGRVLDAEGAPIAGADVIAESGSTIEVEVTGEDGGFILPGLEAGTWTVSITAPGRATGLQEGLELKDDGFLELEFVLPYSFLEEVIVTASRTEQTLLTTPVSVTLVTSKEIAASPADNYADLLRAVPGLNVTQIGARDINFNARSATGRLSNAQLVAVNGRSVYENYFGVVYWDLVTVLPEELSQIEILRTPGSSVWGPNALTGVINLRTKSPRELEGLSVGLTAGELDTRGISLLWADAFEDFSYKISASYFEQDAWERDGLLPDGSPMPAYALYRNEGTRQPKADLRLDWDLPDDSLLSVRAGYAGANGIIHSGLGPFRFDDDAHHHYLEVDWENEHVRVQGYWNRLDAPNTILLFGLPAQTLADTYALDVVANAKLGAHALTYGGTARLNRLDMTIVPQEDARDDYGVFLEDAISIGERWRVVLGGRYDKFETTDGVFAPRVGVTFQPTPDHAVKLAYNKSFRSPSMIENGADIDLPAVCPDGGAIFFQKTLGNLDLEMEELDAIELGYAGKVTDRVSLSATLYRQELENNIRFFPVDFYDGSEAGWPCADPPPPFTAETYSFVNIGTVREQGLELGLHAQIDEHWWLRASYAWRDDPKVTDADPALLQLNRSPEHEAAVGVGYDGDLWSGWLDFNYTDEAYWSDVLTPEFWGWTDDYLLVNARLARRFPGSGLELAVQATNLLDERVKQHVFGDIISRKVSVSLNYRWK